MTSSRFLITLFSILLSQTFASAEGPRALRAKWCAHEFLSAPANDLRNPDLQEIMRDLRATQWEFQPIIEKGSRDPGSVRVVDFKHAISNLNGAIYLTQLILKDSSGRFISMKLANMPPEARALFEKQYHGFYVKQEHDLLEMKKEILTQQHRPRNERDFTQTRHLLNEFIERTLELHRHN